MWYKKKELTSVISNLEEFLKKHFYKMRSDLLHPYVGVKIKSFLKTIDFIEQNLPNAVVCNNRNEVFNYALKHLQPSGLIAEFGVKSGTTINQLSIKPAIKKKIIYGFDSFSGIPDDWHGTKTLQGQLSNQGKLPKVNKNVMLIKGWFKDTLPEFLTQHSENFALIHIDCDIYQSTKDIFDNIGDRLVSGSIIIFDEFFNYPNWQNHEFKALQEFIQSSGKEIKYLCYAHTQIAIKIM